MFHVSLNTLSAHSMSPINLLPTNVPNLSLLRFSLSRADAVMGRVSLVGPRHPPPAQGHVHPENVRLCVHLRSLLATLFRPAGKYPLHTLYIRVGCERHYVGLLARC